MSPAFTGFKLVIQAMEFLMLCMARVQHACLVMPMQEAAAAARGRAGAKVAVRPHRCVASSSCHRGCRTYVLHKVAKQLRCLQCLHGAACRTLSLLTEMLRRCKLQE